MPFTAARQRRKAEFEVDGQNRRPILVLHAHEQAVAGDAGVVHENVQRPGGGLGLPDQLFHRSRIGEVAGDDEGALAQFGGQRVERLAAGARQHHLRALPVQGAGDLGAQAAGRAGHQRDAIVQLKHEQVSISPSLHKPM